MTKKPRILCIDDRVENLRIRTMLLEKFGCDTISVHDYESALRVVAETEVDLLLIDYHLAEGHTGEDIAREVRAMRPGIPLVMLTGDPRLPDSVYNCVDAVLVKGAGNPGTLLETIQKLLPGAALCPVPPPLIPQQSTKAS